MKTNYMNPYVAGTLLGMVLLLAIFLTGHGIGASGAMRNCAISIVNTIDRTHTESSEYYLRYVGEGKKPLKSWITFEIMGVLVGAFVSGAFSKRLKLSTEKSPRISNTVRLIFAFIGGAFFVYGAQLARGCTSGAALSGMAVLSVAGFVTMVAIFGSAYIFAWIFRKLWI
jgi:uncharacterized membrane protein YedE/YeeE